MNAAEEAWRRSELETLACEYHGIFDDTKKRFAKYPRIIKFKLDLLKYLKRRLAAENHLRAPHAVNTVLLRACLCDAVIQDLMPHR